MSINFKSDVLPQVPKEVLPTNYLIYSFPRRCTCVKNVWAIKWHETTGHNGYTLKLLNIKPKNVRTVCSVHDTVRSKTT